MEKWHKLNITIKVWRVMWIWILFSIVLGVIAFLKQSNEMNECIEDTMAQTGSGRVFAENICEIVLAHD